MAYVFKDRNPPPEWPVFKAGARHRSLVPLYRLSWLADWAAYLLGKWAFVELLEYLGSFSLLFAIIFYFADAPNRLKQKHYQAWQVINTAQGKGGNGGRIDALQELNADRVALTGVDMADAFLAGLRLEDAEANRANFSGADLRDAHFERVQLEDANMQWANLRGADLREGKLAGANWNNADLSGASLVGADLALASLERADLSGADLDRLKNWQAIKAIRGANVYNVRNPPAGFIPWAMNQGAIVTNNAF